MDGKCTVLPPYEPIPWWHALRAFQHRAILRNPPCPIQVGSRPVLQHLGQACVQVHRVVGRLAVGGLAQAISEAIIAIIHRNSYPIHPNQPVDAVVAVRIHAIIEQVAVVVPELKSRR
jgi:hypothetical protein